TRKSVEGSIFFCLKGPNFNGNEFAQEALKKGAKIIITDEKKNANEKKFYLVDDTLKCLQKLATKHRKELKIPVVAITGTNGKTSTKNLIYEILNEKYNVIKTTGNLNNHIGLPLSILSIDETHELAVLEFGASKLGDITELCEVGQPNFGLITNIGEAHLNEFINVDNIIKTKTELWTYLVKNNGTIFLNSNDEILNKTHKENKLFSMYNKFIFYSEKEEKIKLKSSSPFLKINWDNQTLNTKIVGEYNLNNIIASIAVGKFFNIKKETVIQVLQKNSFENNRSQYIKTNSNEIILDAYNANPTSMKYSIESFIKIKSKREKILIIGDMLELGKKTKQYHNEIIDLIKENNLNNCFFVGSIFNQIDCNYKKFENKEKLESFLKRRKLKDSIILIKGSRKMKLETLKKLL
ncbi:MAG: UDP-N-acetylmuramoyl-tripeptide--D-alanyl-D-alanine ligase, partial [Bacteroidota bacterium]|nr:UDP-N-acetylmuramoyl-tripeptide--D-alanyl-D-alanine ligase [Bacteroidota bacterium]